MTARGPIDGERFILRIQDAGYPESLRHVVNPPEALYGIGRPAALRPGLAVVGARNATPYGIGCALRFSKIAGEMGLTIISGGARGCDAASHSGALESGAPTVAFLGGGCDRLYPAEHYGLFQNIVNAGGAIVSEHEWDFAPLPYAFRERNRLIAGLAEAVLIVEAGLPSGTFSTADSALDSGKEVLVVPGSIASKFSAGSNRLLLQGAAPIVDDESFVDALVRVFGAFALQEAQKGTRRKREHKVVEAVLAEPLGIERLLEIAQGNREEMMSALMEAESRGIVARNPDGTWGPAIA